MEHLSGLQHVGIPTDDFLKTQKFYENLGFKLVQEEDNAGSHVGFFQLGDLLLEVWEAKVPHQVGAINHLALATDDIAAVFNEIKALPGIEMIDSQIQFLPFWDHGIKYFNFYGPNREIIEICQRLN